MLIANGCLLGRARSLALSARETVGTKTGNTAMTTEDEIMTKEQLAELLHVSKRTVERCVEEARVPYIQLPSRGAKCNVRFLRSNILRWLKRNEQKPLVKLYGLEVANEAEQEAEEAA